MNLNFQCPSCKRTLWFEGGDSAFQTCRHCKGKIIVPSDVFHQHELEQKTPSRQTVTERRNIQLAQVQHALDSGHKIEAIKIFREAFGTDLATAKATVENMQRGGRVASENLTPRGNPADASVKSPSQLQQNQNSVANAGKIISFLIQIAVALLVAYWFLG